MRNENTIYLFFPVQILRATDIQKVCSDALNYAIYSKAKSSSFAESMQYFGLNGGDEKAIISRGQLLHDSIECSALVSVRKQIIVQFHEEDKTKLEVLTFRAYCAIRSILGNKPYCKATNDFMMARMFGFLSVESSEEKLKVIPRYHLDKVKFELQKNWGLVYYSRQTRGFYVTYKLTLEKLIKIAETKRATYQAKQLKIQQDETYKKVMQQLNKSP